MKVYLVKLTGGCMRPLLKSGDMCFIFPKKKISVGDVVLYKYCGQAFLHRVIKVLKEDIVVLDDCGICEPVRISKDYVVGIYPSIFSGWLGYAYHLVVRNLFIIVRKLKNLIRINI